MFGKNIRGAVTVNSSKTQLLVTSMMIPHNAALASPKRFVGWSHGNV